MLGVNGLQIDPGSLQFTTLNSHCYAAFDDRNTSMTQCKSWLHVAEWDMIVSVDGLMSLTTEECTTTSEFICINGKS